MKGLRYLWGYVSLAMFFLSVDPSGVGFRGHIEEIRKWSSGESHKLRFESAKAAPRKAKP